ncbi:MAG TPA: DUF6541 family protein [Pseudonocardiaceae bacterium]|nr:DUF6541 family protein [Pseudonocardiaceae bacterium]
MSWLDAVPVALLSAAWLFAPGLLITYAFGLRSLAAWALAPVVTVALAATTAIVAQKAGVAWSVPLVLLVTLVVAIVVAVVFFLLRRGWPALPADSRRVTLAAVLGLVPAIIIGFITFMHGVVRPDALSQTYDAVLHYNAIASILDTRDASSLTIGTLDIPGEAGSSYPAAWHDMTSLVVLSGHFGIPVAVNMISAVMGILVWPVSCLLLVRQIIGKSATGLAITGVVSIAFTAFPWDLLGFGVLWPNLLGLSITPAILALVISITGQANDDAIGKGRAWTMLPVAFVGAAFAHPNSIFAVIALSLVPIGVALVMRAKRLHGEGRPRRGIIDIVIGFVVFMLFWAWAATTPALATVRKFVWAPFDTPARAVGEVLFQSMNGYNALWILALVVLGAILLCRSQPALRWVVGSFAITGFLYVIAAAFNRPDTSEFTGYWYNDPHRLSAMIPITAVPLAVAGLLYLGRRGATLLERRPRLATALRGRAFAASTLVVVVLLGLLSGGFYVSKHAKVIQNVYVLPFTNPSLQVVGPDELAFFQQQVKKIVPPDVMVANNPWDGSAMLWALADRRVLFPHMSIRVTHDELYLAAHMNEAASDPRVCQIANELHVQYLLIGDHTFWPWDNRTKKYPGMTDPGPGNGFQLVASSGPQLKLYQLTACGRKT